MSLGKRKDRNDKYKKKKRKGTGIGRGKKERKRPRKRRRRKLGNHKRTSKKRKEKKARYKKKSRTKLGKGKKVKQKKRKKSEKRRSNKAKANTAEQLKRRQSGSEERSSSDAREGQHNSFLQQFNGLINQAGRNESRDFPQEETEPGIQDLQYNEEDYDSATGQDVLGTVLKAEEKARESNVKDDPMESRDIPDDEVGQAQNSENPGEVNIKTI